MNQGELGSRQITLCLWLRAMQPFAQPLRGSEALER